MRIADHPRFTRLHSRLKPAFLAAELEPSGTRASAGDAVANLLGTDEPMLANVLSKIGVPVSVSEADARERKPSWTLQAFLESVVTAAEHLGHHQADEGHVVLALSESHTSGIGRKLSRLSPEDLVVALTGALDWDSVSKVTSEAMLVLDEAEALVLRSGRSAVTVCDLLAGLLISTSRGEIDAPVGTDLEQPAIEAALRQQIPNGDLHTDEVVFAPSGEHAWTRARRCRDALSRDLIGVAELTIGVTTNQIPAIDEMLRAVDTTAASLRSATGLADPGTLRGGFRCWDALSAKGSFALGKAAESAANTSRSSISMKEVLRELVAWESEDSPVLTEALSVDGYAEFDGTRFDGREPCPPPGPRLTAALDRAVTLSPDDKPVAYFALVLGLLMDDDLLDAVAVRKPARRVIRDHAKSRVLGDHFSSELSRLTQRSGEIAAVLRSPVSVDALLLAWLRSGQDVEASLLRLGVSEDLLERRLDAQRSGLEEASNDAKGDREVLDLISDAAILAAATGSGKIHPEHVAGALAYPAGRPTLQAAKIDPKELGEALGAPDAAADILEFHHAVQDHARLRILHGTATHRSVVHAADRELGAMLGLGIETSDASLMVKALAGVPGQARRGRALSKAVAKELPVHESRRLRAGWQLHTGRTEAADWWRLLIARHARPAGPIPVEFAASGGGLSQIVELIAARDAILLDSDCPDDDRPDDYVVAEALLDRADLLELTGRHDEAAEDRSEALDVLERSPNEYLGLELRAKGPSDEDLHLALEREPFMAFDSPGERRSARLLRLAARAMAWIEFWVGWDMHDGDVHSALLSRSELNVLLFASGAQRSSVRDLRRIARSRRRFHLGRHPVSLTAAALAAHAQLVAARDGRSLAPRRWRLRRSLYALRLTRADHRRFLGPGHPLTLRVEELTIAAMRELGEHDRAFRNTLRALSAADVARYRFRDTRTREGWRRIYQDLLAHAVGLSEGREDGAALRLTLFEAARGQGVPLDWSAELLQAGSTHSGHLADVPVRPLGHLSVGGQVSAIAEQEIWDLDREQRSAERELVERVLDESPPVDPRDRRPETVDLLEVAAAVTGLPDTWVWSSWDLPGATMSFVTRMDEGKLVTETTMSFWDEDDGSPTELGAALAGFREAMITNDERNVRGGVEHFIERSALTRGGAAERSLLSELGVSLVPQVLREEISRRVREGSEPLPLVVLPAPSWSSIPLAALGMERPASPEADVTRLIEGAIPVLLPGVQFAVAAAERHPTTDTGSPERSAAAFVADQTGRSGALRAAKASLSAETEVLAGGPEATVKRLVEHFSTPEADRPSVFQFVGHAIAGRPGVPGEAYLAMDGGLTDESERLYARDVIHGRFPNLVVPETVVLSACSTWGDQGAADWLGLAPALMWRGAREVVATVWPLLDHPEVASADALIVDRLANSSRPAPEVVRDVQLEFLARQREIAAEEDDWADIASLTSSYNSYLWASFVVVALPRSAVRDTPSTDAWSFDAHAPTDLLTSAHDESR